jgi:hypothetical protein
MDTKTKMLKKLLRLINAWSDMETSIHAAKILMAGVPEEHFQHYFLSMVVAYARPFTKSHGVGRIQCDYPTYPDFGDSDMPVRHRRLIDLRKKFLAHSSCEGTRVQVIPISIPNPPVRAFHFNVGRRTFHNIGFVEWIQTSEFWG